MCVTDHHGIQFRQQRAKRSHFFLFQFLFGAIDGGQLVMGINVRRSVGGKVLAASENAAAAKSAIKCSGKVNDLVRICAVAATFQGVVRVVVIGNIQHRAKVQIEAEKSQQFSRQSAVLLDQFAIPPSPEAVGRWEVPVRSVAVATHARPLGQW